MFIDYICIINLRIYSSHRKVLLKLKSLITVVAIIISVCWLLRWFSGTIHFLSSLNFIFLFYQLSYWSCFERAVGLIVPFISTQITHYTRIWSLCVWIRSFCIHLFLRFVTMFLFITVISTRFFASTTLLETLLYSLSIADTIGTCCSSTRRTSDLLYWVYIFVPIRQYSQSILEICDGLAGLHISFLLDKIHNPNRDSDTS